MNVYSHGPGGPAQVPFAASFETHPIVERVQRVRRQPVAAYGLAVVLVALAVFGRWLVGEHVGARVPFITFYPAIIIATLVGGLWPGIVATVLASLAAWYLFLPPLYSWTFDERELMQLLLFIFICSINVAVVALLNALVDRAVAQEENMRVLVESAPSGIVVVDGQGIIRLINASTEKLFGYQRSELLGRNVEILVPGPLADKHRAERQAFLQKPETRSMGVGRDLSGRRKDGSEFPVEIGLNPVSRYGKSSVLATVIDISERKQAQQSQQLIVRELQHRTQNLFAVFQAIASRSLDEAKTPAEAKFVLNGRVQALSQAYAVLAQAAWEGASLAAILDRQFAGFSNRLNVSGCDIVISPSAAHQFALISHELATNALKYGALSAPDGRVAIEGRVERLNGHDVFSFLWKETGGPPVSPPTRKGFGSVILLDAARQFAQIVSLDYAPQGVTYELQIRLDEVVALKLAAGQQAAATASERGVEVV